MAKKRRTRRNKRTQWVTAVKDNGDGTTTKQVFHINVWERLGPLSVMNELGQTVTIPKQGYQQVDAEHEKPAPAPLAQTPGGQKPGNEPDNEPAQTPKPPKGAGK